MPALSFDVCVYALFLPISCSSEPKSAHSCFAARPDYGAMTTWPLGIFIARISGLIERFLIPFVRSIFGRIREARFLLSLWREAMREMALDLCKIGQLLRETREKKGLTFDEVSNALFIRKRVVGAIEAGDWDNLPHPVYVKGYVTHYATLLNIPGLLRDEAASGGSEPASQSSVTGSVPVLKDHPLSKRFEAAADEARTIKVDKIWRSIVVTSTLKLHELCQKCLLL